MRRVYQPERRTASPAGTAGRQLLPGCGHSKNNGLAWTTACNAAAAPFAQEQTAMLIAAAAVGTAAHLLDRLTRNTANPAWSDAVAGTAKPSPAEPGQGLCPAAAKGVAGLKSTLLGLQAARG